MLSIDVTLVSGTGSGPVNLGLQLPKISEEFPEVANCSHNFFTMQLARPLLVLRPDHRTRPIAWEPGMPEGETFDFLRVQVEIPVGSDPVPAWLYIAHWSEFRTTPTRHEMIVNLDLTVPEGTQGKLLIDQEPLYFPYKLWEAAVV